MKIISTNIGEKKTVVWQGKEVTTGIYKYPVKDPLFLDFDDVANDNVIDRRYHGGKEKACYIYSSDHYKYWKNLYPEIDFSWGMFGENLTVEGLDEKKINIGDVFLVGKALIQVTQPRQPCSKLNIRFQNNNTVNQFIKSGLSGFYVKIIEPGFVETDNSFVLTEKKDSVSIHQVFELLYTDKPKKSILDLAINDPNLAESCRRDLIKRWG